MKKLLLLSAIAMGAMSANAIEVSVTVGGEPVENGSTVISKEYNQDLTEDGEDSYIRFQLFPEVFMTPNADGNLTVTVYNTTPNSDINSDFRQQIMTEGSDPYGVQLCWPSNCITAAPGGKVESSDAVIAGLTEDLKIDSTPIYFFYPFTTTVPDGFSVTAKIEISSGSEVIFSFNLKMVYEDETGGVEGIGADNDVAPVYYNLSGMRVNNPDKGIYIVKKGDKTSKVIL